jgi:hypothetical protein
MLMIERKSCNRRRLSVFTFLAIEKRRVILAAAFLTSGVILVRSVPGSAPDKIPMDASKFLGIRVKPS